MAIGNAFDAAKVTSLYCINFVWDLIGGDNYLPSDDRRLYAPETPAHCDLIRDIFGNPFRPVVADPAWLTPTVQSIASAIYADRAFDRLPILADALEEAGCTDADVLLHCRIPGEHVRGCWVVDLVLGKT